MKQPEKSANSWLKELMEEKFITGKCDDVPEGWITLNDMAFQCNVAPTTMNSRITKLIKLNVIQRKKYRVNTGRGIAEVWHYYKK
jgi:hypothetical protein